jgi:transcriptional regulator of acetoin/glycerol metabolism
MPDDFLDDIEEAGAGMGTSSGAVAAPSAQQMVASGANLEEMELTVILKSLEANGGNVSATARALGVSRNTIYRKLPHLK